MKRFGCIFIPRDLIHGKNSLLIFNISQHYFVNVCRKEISRHILKKNPLKNKRVMIRLNPYHKVAQKDAKYLQVMRARKKQELINKKRGVCEF